MAPRGGGTTGTLGLGGEDEKWVNVSWMPHASLSQTSHVCLAVLSAHVSLDELTRSKPEEWEVLVNVCGIGGIPLVSVASSTPSSGLWSRKNRADQRPLPTQLSPSISAATHDCRWNHVVQIPIRWRDLPRDAYLHLEVVTKRKIVLYQTTLPFFDAYGKLCTGLQLLELKPPNLDESTQNPGLVSPPKRNSPPLWQEKDPVWKASRILHQLERFDEPKREAATNRANAGRAFGEIPSVPWLDTITKEHCRRVLSDAAEKKRNECFFESATSHLIVELPVFEVPVMHEETFYPVPQHGASGSVTPLDLSLHRKMNPPEGKLHPLALVPFLDYENEHDNPVEDKYRALAHDLLRGLVDPALKPDREQRDRLNAIIASPSHHPTREEKDLLWRFRFSLVDNRRALTKFLLAVDWTVESEVVQAAELLEQWRKRSPIEVTDALKLLGKDVAFQTNLVRSYAIDTLAAAPDEELRLYLLQLVQALKYENMQGPDSLSPRVGGASSSSHSSPVSSLGTFLIGRASKNLELANYLYWYLKVELQDPTHGSRYKEVFSALQYKLSETPCTSSGGSKLLSDSSESSAIGSGSESGKEPRSSTLQSLVGSVSKLGSSFRADDHPSNTGQASSRTHKLRACKSMWDVLLAQDKFVSGVMDIQKRCRDARGKKDAKEAQLRSMLSKEGFDKNPQRDAVPLPSAPYLMVNGVNPNTAKMFKSALYPALVDFHVSGVASSSDTDYGAGRAKGSAGPRNSDKLSSYKVIVKTGDDLRQDQLVIMMIQLMDGLLKRAALDLCLTPYSIIATSPTSGLVEFVDGSSPISQILANFNNSIMQFFRAKAPQKGARYDVRPDVISTYVRSCAGYCVITYLLGVGDRHLDNLLLNSRGHFFHIDFGFIFGRDPKPLPPAFRLTREMVEGMGGLESPEYRQFCSLARQAFTALRKSAGLVLNLLHLMSDAGIEDLSNNPSADAEGVIAKVEERFKLELTDEQAEHYFDGLIEGCLNAIAPRLMDALHAIAVARR